jgi:2-polyprenyl-3-methyl-5-hydroxy-6-metoxy-1,4-benzoquinol methylase
MESRFRRALAPVLARRAARRYRTGPLRRRFPATPDELRRSPLLDTSWYYAVELLPGVLTTGHYPPELPMLPRLMLRRADVAGMTCLDMGTVEGLTPTLLVKRGAARVTAVDYSRGALAKLAAVRHYHDVDFEFRAVGLMYDLHRRLPRRGYDLVNLSGLLYHVFSPLTLLAAVRPLVKRNGLVLVSTSVTLDPDDVMDFNSRGRLLDDPTTFWYPSLGLLEYLLRYVRLEPIDCAFLPHADVPGVPDYGKPGAYLSVMCRAVAGVDGDPWMRESVRTSWESQDLCDWRRADRQPESTIAYRNAEPDLDLRAAVGARPPVPMPAAEDDSHLLRLDARS